MLKPQGYVTISTPEGGLVERDTFSCGHCNFIVTVNPGEPPDKMGGFCRTCMKLICERCNNKGVCTPLMKAIEKSEDDDYHRRQRGY